MGTPSHDDASIRATRWLLGGLNGWVEMYSSLVAGDLILEPGLIERLERSSDQIAGFVREQKRRAGMDQNSKTY